MELCGAVLTLMKGDAPQREYVRESCVTRCAGLLEQEARGSCRRRTPTFGIGASENATLVDGWLV